MRIWIVAALAAIMTVVSAGCSDNGGDIGLWGGTWHLVRIEIDGTVDESYAGNVFWKFQADVVDMVETDDEMHERQDHYGTWHVSADGRALTLDFSHSSDRFPAGSEEYVPPSVTGLNAGLTVLDVERLTGREMVVKQTDAESDTERTFVLKKQ